MGGSSKQTIGYKYYLGMHMILCHGPIDSISRISVDDRLIWSGNEEGGQIEINQGRIFGGDEKEGGIEGLVDIEMGGPSQGKNDYLESILGSLIPAYRRVVGVVLRRPYLGTSPYLKNWSFRGTRVLKRSFDGSEQWYPSKAVIFPADIIDSPVVEYTSPWELAYGPDITPPSSPLDTGYAPASPGQFSRVVDISTGTLLDLEPAYWLRNTFDFPEDGTVTFSGSGDNSCTIYFDGSIIHNPNPNNNNAPGMAFSFDKIITKGEHTIHVYFRDETPIQIDNATFYLKVEYAEVDQKDMNGIHIIRECLTDLDFGMGYQDADMDDDSLEYAADVIHSEGLGISLLWDRSVSIEDFIKEVCRHIDASIYVSRKTGKYIVKLIRADYDVGDLITLDETNISSVSNPNKPSFGELTNSITVKFWNYKTGKEDSVTVTDTAMVQMNQNQIINAEVNYPGFTNPRNATLAAQRDLKSLSSPFFSCTIYADKTAEDLNIGDVFLFSWAKWQISEMVMRVTGIAFGDGKSNKIRIDCSEDIYSTPSVPVIVTNPGEWIDPSQEPSAIQNVMATEAPYYEIVQTIGQDSADSLLDSNPELGYVVAAASRPANSINGNMWTDSGSGYETASELDFCAFGFLREDITAAETNIYLDNAVDLDLVEVGKFLQIRTSNSEMEICRVDSINETTRLVIIGRGCLDTTPKPHPQGSQVFFWDEYYASDSTEYVLGEEIGVKVTSTSGRGETDVSSAPENLIEISQRALRPYPPGSFQINTEYYPEGPLSGLLELTWTDRDRLQQTDATIYDHTFGDIGPEAGTTYRVRGYTENVLVHTESSAVSGTDWTPALEGNTRIEIHSLRDSLYSLQPAVHEFYYTSSFIRVLEDDTDDEVRRNEDGLDIRLTED